MYLYVYLHVCKYTGCDILYILYTLYRYTHTTHIYICVHIYTCTYIHVYIHWDLEAASRLHHDFWAYVYNHPEVDRISSVKGINYGIRII